MTGAADIFTAGGPIDANLESYEVRESQIAMAAAVESAIEREGVLLAEAGTGTGKTLAYLVPLIQSSGTAIISTGTKTLQEQIFFKDIEFLSRVFDRPIDAVCLKGQNNYLCLRRLSDFERSPRVLSYDSNKVKEIADWANTTLTGDRMELKDLEDNDPIWREICSTKDTRIGTRCPHVDDCFFSLARKDAMNAKLVIVNHHLYFADLATRQAGGAILPKHDVAVFDEAHLIEDIATEFFSLSVSSAKVERVCRDALAAVGAAKLQDDSAEKTRPKYVDTAKRVSRSFFERFKSSEGRVRFDPEEMDREDANEYFRVDTALETVQQSLKLLEGMEPSIDQALKRLTELREQFAAVLLETKKGFVHWVENRKRSVVLGASPIDISEVLREGVFFGVPSVILSSATLSTAGNFTYLKSRLGLDFDVEELSLPSPFDYENQARVYLPKDMPDPRQPEFVDEVAVQSSKLINLTAGGALILFTSIQNMRSVHALLEGMVSNPLLMQGQAPRSMLLQRLVDDPESVLCATASFWQGVDIPGDALRLVIIDKLPFASPADPLMAARIADLKEKGQKPFIEYQVPQAALALKQGVGRLIRTASDRGILSVLDKRLHTMGYKKAFLSALPASPRTNEFVDIKKWWIKKTGGEIRY